MINVTKTFLPEQDMYQAILKRAWDHNWITNRGDLVLELEERLRSYLGVDHIILTTNGTLALQIAIKALELKGDIITTPFSYVASTSSIVWENCVPVFVDIHPEYLTIDESKIEAAITSETVAILATHVFGNPCHVEFIETLAKKHDLKVIYDGAHAFGVQYRGSSIFEFGDISTCSFHATKVFHTGEGGALFANDPELSEVLFYHHNFGHEGPEKIQGLGINAKMSELQAALGLAVLPHIGTILENRQTVAETYNQNLDFSNLKGLKIREGTQWNYGYYPVICKSEEALLEIRQRLNREDIFPRRYFYPSLNTLPYIRRAECPVSESIANTIMCLPIYASLEEDTVLQICKIVNS